MAHRSPLGLDMAVCGAQNAAYANIKSRIATAWPFGYLGPGKNYRELITLALLTPSLFFNVSTRSVSAFNWKTQGPLSGVCVKQGITITTFCKNLNPFLTTTAPIPTSGSMADSGIYDNR